jgi:hypothetical protein
MSSPTHAEIIMDERMEIAGWAAKDYPTDMESLTLGAGMYNATTGEYSSTETTIYFTEPVEITGWVLQLSRKDE